MTDASKEAKQIEKCRLEDLCRSNDTANNASNSHSAKPSSEILFQKSNIPKQEFVITSNPRTVVICIAPNSLTRHNFCLVEGLRLEWIAGNRKSWLPKMRK
ncbi:hypothetical protein ES288_D07G082100v1 [Gossypium darwinii]|uniref:Uncharacterized protein n=1 Tax=Gossypium darwinii TaxID=34276 RepID=A0A5D2BTF0_GOSDA|nr:hypothetical protein ES288_D07G082100v1 [Gossypium darwinii]